MGFRNLGLKSTYRSVIDDVPNDFFNRVLPETRLYLRAAGYYSSNSLKAISYGLSKMVWKTGRMKLLVSPEISESDLEAIKRGELTPEKVVEEVFLSSEAELENLMANDNVRALAYLVANGSLEIKFVLTSGITGLFHMKFGIMYDDDNDIVSFSGSLNESEAGLIQNAEEIKVFKSYVEGQSVFIEPDISFFLDLFDGMNEFGNFYVVNLPEKSRQRLVDASRKLERGQATDVLPPLRHYQSDAIQALKANNMRGIVEMATGTGKTRVALESLNWIKSQSKKPLLALVLAPASVLVNQWNTELLNFFKVSPLVFGSSGTSRMDDLYSITHALNKAECQIIPCVCTYDYALNPAFLSTLFSAKGCELAIVCDEVHWIGAPTYSRIMEMDFKYRIGLSATPSRLFDENGTAKIISYFGSVVFEYKLGQAIEDHFLSEFNYYPIFVPMLWEEMNEYLRLSKRISFTSKKKTTDMSDGSKEITVLLNRRSKILKKAKNKVRAFTRVVRDLMEKDTLKNALIFFEDKDQISDYLGILNRLCVSYSKLSGDENAYERKKTLDRFSKGEIDCIVSMKVLDEGVDLRKADKILLLASTSNPRQYIQRCGRVLRTYPNKPMARIYDFLVYPELHGMTSADPFEKEILNKEFKRAYYFATYSSNKGENLVSILEIARKFNISLKESG